MSNLRNRPFLTERNQLILRLFFFTATIIRTLALRLIGLRSPRPI